MPAAFQSHKAFMWAETMIEIWGEELEIRDNKCHILLGSNTGRALLDLFIFGPIKPTSRVGKATVASLDKCCLR